MDSLRNLATYLYICTTVLQQGEKGVGAGGCGAKSAIRGNQVVEMLIYSLFSQPKSNMGGRRIRKLKRCCGSSRFPEMVDKGEAQSLWAFAPTARTMDPGARLTVSARLQTAAGNQIRTEQIRQRARVHVTEVIYL